MALKKLKEQKISVEGSSAPEKGWLYAAGVCLARAVIRRIAQSRVCSLLGLRAVQALYEKLPALDVPAAHRFFIYRLRPLLVGQLFGQATHEVGQFAVGPLRPALEPGGGLPALSLQHRAKIQPFKEGCPYHTDGPAAVVVALIILRPGLGDFQKTGFFQQGYGSFNPALTDPGCGHQGFHVDVNEAMIHGWRAETEGGQIQMRQDGLNDDLQSLTAFAADSALCSLEWRALARMLVPGLCPFRRQRQNARESAFALPDRMGRAEAWPFWIVAATVSGRGAHFSTLFIP